MIKYNSKKIAQIVDGKLVGDGEEEIKYLLTDSRTIVSATNSLFFAITGERHNGHNHIEECINKGVRSFIVSNITVPSTKDKELNVNYIIVEDTLKAFHNLATFHRENYKIPIIGITGSNGKTVLKEWLFQLLNEDYRIVRSPKSYNSQIGVPHSVCLLNDSTELGIFEAGISFSGEMSKLQKIIKPTIGIFSNIGDPHQENFIDHKHKISEKLKLFEDCEILIYCKDYQLIDHQIHTNKNFEDFNFFTWSSKFPADLFIKNIAKEKDHTLITGKYQSKDIQINIPFIDNASIENAIHGWCLMLYLKYPNNLICNKMNLLSSVAMRLELKQGLNNCTIINDSYNSDVNSLLIALDFANQQQQNAKKTLILSDILQSGKDKKVLYKDVADLIKKKNFDHFIGIGDIISQHKDFFTIEKSFYSTTEEFLQNINKYEFKDRLILLKGARNFEFERISNILQLKVHETVLEINLNAVTKNLNYFKSLLKPETKIVVMVKAFSYGSGMFEIANLLQFQRVNYLAVAFADEGVELRKAGVSLPIIVLNPEIQSFDLMIEHNLEPEIYNFRVLKLFSESVDRNRINSFPIHIKIDTGMKRLGFCEEEISELLEKLKINNRFILKSVFSHLAAADNFNEDIFTINQIKQFENISNLIIKEFDYPVLRHILNSAGVERFPDAQFDMVRIGIGLYGISALKQKKLHNVSCLKTSISQIKILKQNDTVGYNRKGKLQEGSKIAIVPIGYADGLNRKLSNGKGKMLINGKIVPIVGNICMDMCMLDISGINAEEGDEVVVFGDNYHISEIAGQLGTIPYEIMSGISQRVKRIYFHE